MYEYMKPGRRVSIFLIRSTLHRHACSIGIEISITLTESDGSIAERIDPFQTALDSLRGIFRRVA